MPKHRDGGTFEDELRWAAEDLIDTHQFPTIDHPPFQQDLKSVAADFYRPWRTLTVQEIEDKIWQYVQELQGTAPNVAYQNQTAA